MKLKQTIKIFLLLLYSFSSPFFFVTFQATITLLMLLIGLALGQTQVQQVPTGQFGCGILKIVNPKMQEFCPRINLLKGKLFTMNYGSSKSAEIVLSKSIFYFKNQRNFFEKKIIEEYQFRRAFFVKIKNSNSNF